jgi:exosortase/archaeosortase family protein
VFTPTSSESLIPRPRFGLLARLLAVAAVLGVETLLISGLIQSPALDALTGAAKITHDIQHWVFRFAIAYLGSFAILLYLRGSDKGLSMLAADAPGVAAPGAHAPVRVQWLLVHAALLAGFAVLSTLLYRGGDIPFAVLALAWHACGLAAALALFASIAPLQFWTSALRQTGALPLYSLLPAAGALLVFKLSQWLWAPAAAITFKIAGLMVHPLVPSLRTDASSLTLVTDHFAVQVSEICSGLEGVGLMLAFCTAWLFYFRREYIFPRALIIVPIGMLLIFLLNSVRIAALVLIGDAGYQKIAAVGFHSQAGWIAFNVAAFAVAYAAKRSTWLNRVAHQADTAAHDAAAHDGAAADAARTHDATAAYLMPLLAILAAGMLAHAMSSGFDFLYPVRIVAAVGALWVYRRSYANLNWRFTWRGVIGRHRHVRGVERVLAFPEHADRDTGGTGEPVKRGACRVDCLPSSSGHHHGAHRRGTRLPRLLDAPSCRRAVRLSVVFQRALASDRHQLRALWRHSWRFVVCRHHRGGGVRRAGGENRKDRRIGRRSCDDQLAPSGSSAALRCLAALVSLIVSWRGGCAEP